nr:MAG TPA: hypothetical protein [Caudoviricetes sp.]
MAEMSNEMIVGMVQQHLDCLQRFVKADGLSALDLEFMVHHAWEIENYIKCLLNRKRKEDEN